MNEELKLLWRMFAVGIGKKKVSKLLLSIEPPTEFYYKLPKTNGEIEFVLLSKRHFEEMNDENDAYDEVIYDNAILDYDTKFLQDLLKVYSNSLSVKNFEYLDDCFLFNDCDEILNILNNIDGIIVSENNEIDLEDFGIYDEEYDDDF